MNMKKIIGGALAFFMAVGTVLSVPVTDEGENSISAYGFDLYDDMSGIPSNAANKYNIDAQKDILGYISMTWDKVPNAFYYEIGIYQPKHGKEWGEWWNVSDVADKDSGLYYYIPGNALFNDLDSIPTDKYLNAISSNSLYYLTMMHIDKCEYTFYFIDMEDIDSETVLWVKAYDKYNKELGKSCLKIKDCKKYFDDKAAAEAAAEAAKAAEEAAAKASILSAPKTFKAETTSSKIKLSWNAVDGADMYRVYMYNAKTKKYEVCKTTSSNKCVISGLSAGKSYRFKIAAYDKVNGKYVRGELSRVITVKTKSK